MAGVLVEALVKAWGDARAVDDISFSVEQGSLTVLLGPSGCGKSTTLRILAGLETATGGTIRIGGQDVAGRVGAARGVSMVFQSYALFPHMTVADNITFGLSVRHVAKPEIAERLARVASILGLEPFLARKPSQLSGGQQQRVALGRALIAEAPVCLMDEPLSNLDAKLRQDLRREIRSLQQRLGMTMIYVTHDQTEAMSMADQVILMNGGRIEQAGTASDLYSRPASMFAARFVGGSPMSFIDLDNDASGRNAVFQGVDHPPVLSRPGKGLVLGMRSEDVQIATSTVPDGHWIDGPDATAEDIEYLGADALVTCRVGRHRIGVRVRGADAPPSNITLPLRFRADAMHVFDRDSGNRIEPAGEPGRLEAASPTAHHREPT
ncbi:ABC transporter ATP-binding protein [Neorhizobium sp. NCHU2750]|uniref:ABC transporter ATP-binding protein n=1 Tax=Neorhizobium sp. NCHU2750 TaxID=1825976 RepID=UPI000E7256FF|nr:sn-glycerol 3-phosphate ABC transporter ATP-binding protein [Neorhizobium sp. NCHU2750]